MEEFFCIILYSFFIFIIVVVLFLKGVGVCVWVDVGVHSVYGCFLGFLFLFVCWGFGSFFGGFCLFLFVCLLVVFLINVVFLFYV